MPHNEIDPEKEYSPMDIKKNGFILDTEGKPDYRYVLRLIELGKLRARNVCQGKYGKIFKIKGKDIIDWKKTTAEKYYKPRKKKSVYTFKKRPFPQEDNPGHSEPSVLPA